MWLWGVKVQKFKLSILVVEDCGSRINTFIEFLGHHNLTMTDNSYDAKEYLYNNMYDVIYLDYKLGEDNGTGIEVAHFIAKLSYDPEVIFHSWDIFAFDKLQKILPQATNVHYNTEEFYRLENTLYG